MPEAAASSRAQVTKQFADGECPNRHSQDIAAGSRLILGAVAEVRLTL